MRRVSKKRKKKGRNKMVSQKSHCGKKKSHCNTLSQTMNILFEVVNWNFHYKEKKENRQEFIVIVILHL